MSTTVTLLGNDLIHRGITLKISDSWPAGVFITQSYYFTTVCLNDKSGEAELSLPIPDERQRVLNVKQRCRSTADDFLET
jgi:hypothetical protein